MLSYRFLNSCGLRYFGLLRLEILLDAYQPTGSIAFHFHPEYGGDTFLPQFAATQMTTRRHKLEDHNPHSYRCKPLKSRFKWPRFSTPEL
jgi:hypothetical protein